MATAVMFQYWEPFSSMATGRGGGVIFQYGYWINFPVLLLSPIFQYGGGACSGMATRIHFQVWLLGPIFQYGYWEPFYSMATGGGGGIFQYCY